MCVLLEARVDFWVFILIVILILIAVMFLCKRWDVSEKSLLSDVERGNNADTVPGSLANLHLLLKELGRGVLDWITPMFIPQTAFIEDETRQFESSYERRFRKQSTDSHEGNVPRHQQCGSWDDKQRKLKLNRCRQKSLGLDAKSIPYQTLTACPATAIYPGDKWNTMRYEQNRFGSFDGVEASDLPSSTRPTRLAARGFYFDWILRKPRCFSCGEIYPGHLPDCDWHSDNITFPQPPSPPPSPVINNPQILNIVTRPPLFRDTLVPLGGTHNSQDVSGELSPARGLAVTPSYPAFGNTQRPARDSIREPSSQGLDQAGADSTQLLGATGGHSPRPSTCSNISDNLVQPCRFCREYPVATVFLPCGHSVACGTCGEDLDVCVICNMVIQQRVATQ